MPLFFAAFTAVISRPGMRNCQKFLGNPPTSFAQNSFLAPGWRRSNAQSFWHESGQFFWCKTVLYDLSPLDIVMASLLTKCRPRVFRRRFLLSCPQLVAIGGKVRWWKRDTIEAWIAEQSR
jgi:hypothetical protein